VIVFFFGVGVFR